MTATVYLSLGSNLGDRAKHFQNAIAALDPAGVRVVRVSSFYETEPVDYLEQPWFVNCAVEAETQLAPLALLRALQEIETQIGPTKSVPKGPRTIDIDILFYAGKVIDTPQLQVPHPRMHLRRFVLVPLNEIAPNTRHPVLSATVSSLLQRTPDASKVRPLEPPGG